MAMFGKEQFGKEQFGNRDGGRIRARGRGPRGQAPLESAMGRCGPGSQKKRTSPSGGLLSASAPASETSKSRS